MGESPGVSAAPGRGRRAPAKSAKGGRQYGVHKPAWRPHRIRRDGGRAVADGIEGPTLKAAAEKNGLLNDGAGFRSSSSLETEEYHSFASSSRSRRRPLAVLRSTFRVACPRPPPS